MVETDLDICDLITSHQGLRKTLSAIAFKPDYPSVISRYCRGTYALCPVIKQLTGQIRAKPVVALHIEGLVAEQILLKSIE